MKTKIIQILMLLVACSLSEAAAAELYSFKKHDSRLQTSNLYKENDKNFVHTDITSSIIHMKGSHGSKSTALILDLHNLQDKGAALLTGKYARIEQDNLAEYVGGEHNLELISKMAAVILPKIYNRQDPYSKFYQVVLQAAIWEIKYNGATNFLNPEYNTYTLTDFVDRSIPGSNTSIHPQDKIRLESWLKLQLEATHREAVTAHINPQSLELYCLVNTTGNGPHLLGFSYTQPTAATPLPAAAWLAATGISFLFALHRRQGRLFSDPETAK